MEIMEWRNNEFIISTDKNKLQPEIIHHYLCNESYWAGGIPLAVVKKSIQHSLCFGIYNQADQIGFARVISDFATYAYLGDVFILEQFRGRGLSKWLMKIIMSHPELQGLRRFVLATKDAHGLYAQFGFEVYGDPERLMAVHNPDVYKTK